MAWRVSLQDLFAYYLCFKCRKPYFGGERVCGEGGGAFDPTELVCGGCSPWSGEIDCPKHGKDFIEFKCRFCCSVAVRGRTVALGVGGGGACEVAAYRARCWRPPRHGAVGMPMSAPPLLPCDRLRWRCP